MRLPLVYDELRSLDHALTRLTSAGDSDIFRLALDQADPAPAATLSATSSSSLANDLALLSLLTDSDGTAANRSKKRL